MQRNHHQFALVMKYSKHEARCLSSIGQRCRIELILYLRDSYMGICIQVPPVCLTSFAVSIEVRALQVADKNFND